VPCFRRIGTLDFPLVLGSAVYHAAWNFFTKKSAGYFRFLLPAAALEGLLILSAAARLFAAEGMPLVDFRKRFPAKNAATTERNCLTSTKLRNTIGGVAKPPYDAFDRTSHRDGNSAAAGGIISRARAFRKSPSTETKNL